MIREATTAALAAILLAACTAAEPEAAQASAADAPGEGWELVWSDDFEGDTLDPAKWRPEVSCWGGGNDERQCYTGRPENVSVEDGLLLLKARRETFTGPDRPPEIAAEPNPQTTQEYTSGKVRTRGLHAWRYGRIEVRARVPEGQGTWSAIWMMPAEDHYGPWPLSGEIDILEAVNIGASCEECEGGVGENRTLSALHFGDRPPENAHVDHRTALPGLARPSEDFHVYAVEWGEGLIRFLVDGRVHFTATPEDWHTASPLADGNPNAPFDRPFYLMANLAVGGGLSERNNDKGFVEASFPAQLAIDWVRVYRCAEDPDKGLACMR
ncbi:glycoside hydrolase family 16 protein [Erythrobacter sp.]|uniref:glycoside hydrolase family 16 protein n=1 Tax=Erythrobacter sp. TaxID=1042 RepID=UPI001425FE83|nr:glycoside hydrolase family 16 protein [Erythrobacter sp.]QIQ86349.1 MAG: glycoside hydrolase family 16 protein [Erythrobacter sp.]